MNLEDHLGDVIRKARTHAGLSAEQAGAAAGVDAATLSKIEEDGIAPLAFNFGAFARLAGIDGPKLEGLAKGWRPKPVDLEACRELRMITTRRAYSVNAYLVWDEVTREAALFDTGWDAAPALAAIEASQLQLNYLFLTHMHEDHVAGLKDVRDRFPKVKVRTNSRSAPPDQRNRANDCLHLGSLRITNRETPGHAEEGVTYVVGNFPEDGPFVAIVGDAIFAGSMGRGNQSADLARQKVREQILTLPGSTIICPGHGPLTTVAEEKAHNPFF